MGTTPLFAAVAVNPSKKIVPLAVDAEGNLRTVAPPTDDYIPVYNITAATVVKAAPGQLLDISVVVAGSAAGSVNDCATTGAAAASNKVMSVPNTVEGPLGTNWTCVTGICITPGTGQTLAVLYV